MQCDIKVKIKLHGSLIFHKRKLEYFSQYSNRNEGKNLYDSDSESETPTLLERTLRHV